MAGDSRAKRTQDHPRGCGEKEVAAGARQVNMGSPPRVRGKAYKLPGIHALIWITPAGAGKSLFR